MIVLDSDVVSTLMLEIRDKRLEEWLNRQPILSLVTTTITVYEIQRGIDLLPEGHRRRRLSTAFGAILSSGFQNRILPLNNAAAREAARLSAERTKRGLNIGWQDTMIAGIALANGAVVATRNFKDFRDLGARVINPWDASGG